MIRFIKECLVLVLDFLDAWDARRFARDAELLRLQKENDQLTDRIVELTYARLREAKAERQRDRDELMLRPGQERGEA